MWMEAGGGDSPVVLCPDQVNFGLESYAHFVPGRGVLRFAMKIADASDIERLGEFEQVAAGSKRL